MKTITCPECKGWGYLSYGSTSGLFACETCSGEGTIDVPTTQADLDELGIPASADDLGLADEPEEGR